MLTLLKLFCILALVKCCYSASEEMTLKAFCRIHQENSSVFESDFFNAKITAKTPYISIKHCISAHKI